MRGDAIQILSFILNYAIFENTTDPEHVDLRKNTARIGYVGAKSLYRSPVSIDGDICASSSEFTFVWIRIVDIVAYLYVAIALAPLFNSEHDISFETGNLGQVHMEITIRILLYLL